MCHLRVTVQLQCLKSKSKFQGILEAMFRGPLIKIQTDFANVAKLVRVGLKILSDNRSNVFWFSCPLYRIQPNFIRNYFSAFVNTTEVSRDHSRALMKHLLHMMECGL